MNDLTPRSIIFPRRRARLLALAVAALAAAFALLPVAAQADTSNTLTIVGTSDVSDSGLIPNLIGPEFEQAYPQFAFKYEGNATLTAINDAENGSLGASMLIVHAASLENQFVANGYSYNNQYGYAIFRNDFVLAGPTAANDANSADVQSNGTHDIVQAFIDVAQAGYNGGGTPKATFISRGGAPGTVVAEHGIWQLVYQNDPSDIPADTVMCTVSSANGGGMAPLSSTYAATNSISAGDPCPNSGGSPTEAMVPAWYEVTGLTQGPNVVAANACTGDPGNSTNPIQSGANTCYVFTDRGTYDYLSSGTDSSGTNTYYTIPNLSLLTYDNSSTALGGTNELINYFHAYIVNPNANTNICDLCEQVNLTAAQDFIKFITSAPIQSQLANYLKYNTGDSLGAPFVADASPDISASGLPSTDAAGKSVTVAGNVTNAEPGYPTPTGETVSVSEVVAGTPVAIPGATDVVSGNAGAYSITFTPPSSGSYEVTTQQISQVEDPNLSPVFGDILSPGASTPTTITVDATASISSAKVSPGGVTVSGAVGPASLDANGKVAILARKVGSTGSYSEIGSVDLAAGQSTYAVSASLGAGSWDLEATYSDPGQVASGTSAPSSVTVSSSPPPHTVSIRKSSAKKGKVTISGKLTPAPTSSGAAVELLAVSTSSLKKTTLERAFRARAASVGLKEIAKTSVKSGKTTFTIKAKLKRGFRWVIQLEYVQKGQTSAYSKLGSLNVK